MNRDQMRRNQQVPIVISFETDGIILALWRQGCDTLAIAKHMHLTEFQVHNRLLHIREAAR